MSHRTEIILIGKIWCYLNNFEVNKVKIVVKGVHYNAI